MRRVGRISRFSAGKPLATGKKRKENWGKENERAGPCERNCRIFLPAVIDRFIPHRSTLILQSFPALSGRHYSSLLSVVTLRQHMRPAAAAQLLAGKRLAARPARCAPPKQELSAK
jgi:hypothetical protein